MASPTPAASPRVMSTVFLRPNLALRASSRFDGRSTGTTGQASPAMPGSSKEACRSRGAPPTIRPNAFAPSPGGPATAEIVCGLAGTKPPHLVAGRGALRCKLAMCSCSDAATAEHYLEEDGPTAFTPRVFGHSPKLSKCCDTISVSLQQEIDQLNQGYAWFGKELEVYLATGSRETREQPVRQNQAGRFDRLSQLTEGEAQRLRGVGRSFNRPIPSRRPWRHALQLHACAALLRRLRPQRKHCRR